MILLHHLGRALEYVDSGIVLATLPVFGGHAIYDYGFPEWNTDGTREVGETSISF